MATGLRLTGMGKLRKALKDIGRTYSGINDRRKFNAIRMTEADIWVERNFRSEGRFGQGSKWEELKPATLDARRKGKNKGAGQKILQDRSWLKNHRKHFYSADAAIIDFTEPYAATHEFGRGKIPARPFLPEDDKRGTDVIHSRAWKSFMRLLGRKGLKTPRLLK
jgi:phage gpG-like protein